MLVNISISYRYKIFSSHLTTARWERVVFCPWCSKVTRIMQCWHELYVVTVKVFWPWTWCLYNHVYYHHPQKVKVITRPCLFTSLQLHSKHLFNYVLQICKSYKNKYLVEAFIIFHISVIILLCKIPTEFMDYGNISYGYF